MPSNYLYETYFLQNWLPRWNQTLTQLKFIHNWVITSIQWMVQWWALVYRGWLVCRSSPEWRTDAAGWLSARVYIHFCPFSTFTGPISVSNCGFQNNWKSQRPRQRTVINSLKAFETTDDSLILEYLKNWNQQFIKNSKELPNIHLYLGCNQKQTALIGN